MSVQVRTLVIPSRKVVRQSARQQKKAETINRIMQQLRHDYRGQDVHVWVAYNSPATRGGLRHVYLGFASWGMACHWLNDKAPAKGAPLAVYAV